MKTDYASLGRRALERLKSTCESADEVQRELLSGILAQNKNTEFGRKHRFSEIRRIADYQRAVPLSGYDDYAGDISRIINGGGHILTAENPIYFCISSGTTGDEKFIPVTGSDVKIQYLYDYGLVFGTVREYYKDTDETEIFGKIFQIGEFGKTFMRDGRIKGIRSGCVYLCAEKYAGFDASDYCVPKEILFPESLEDQLYIKVRFALAERELTAVHGVFINRVAGVMDYILQNWDMLLNDMEMGTADRSVKLSEEQRRYVARRLPPDPGRAAELRKIPRGGSDFGIMRKIWKKMKYILAIGGSSFPYFTEKMLGYAGDIPICHYAYASSECVFGVAGQMNVPDRYILFPEAAFFEFIPVKNPARPLVMSEIRPGERYELAFTNRSGLYRYRLGDVVEVVGRYGKAPVVKYCYRINQAVNIAGEKTNCEQLSAAVKRFSEITGTGVTGYCVCGELSGIAPRYLFYIESTENAAVGNAGEILEQCMREANFEYRSCADMNEIAPLRVEFLRVGSFKKYERELAASGKNMGQSKLLRFLDTDEKKKFFAEQTLEKGHD